ncbi:MAG TPA: hypothetical protein VK956_08520, partial [Verrucomicrobium sp.]|nr:hypothetical protein [Verrucomicrobium sp.]
PEGPERIAALGTVRNLVIPLRFLNHKQSNRKLPRREDFDKIFNAQGGDPKLAPTGSVRDGYLENSYGQFELNSTVGDCGRMAGLLVLNGTGGDCTTACPTMPMPRWAHCCGSFDPSSREAVEGAMGS